MTKPLLDFTTLEPERPVIRIDGKPYTLALLSDFGLTEQSKLARLMTEATAIEQRLAVATPPEPTGNADTDAVLAHLEAVPEDEAVKVVALLDAVLGLILRAPAEVRARLSEPQKRQVIEAFMPAVMAVTPTDPKSRQSRSMSGRSRRSSPRPTAPVSG